MLFSTFVGMAQGGDANWMDFAGIPVSIVLGIALGAAAGFALSQFFETAYAHKRRVRNSVKVIVVLGISFLLMAMETWLVGVLSLSGLLAVVSMACVLKMKSAAFVSKRLSEKFGKLWLAAEWILFVLVGRRGGYPLHAACRHCVAAHDLHRPCFPFHGRCLCLVKTPLTGRERLFCMIAYLPKATVQAAIGLGAPRDGVSLRPHRAVGCGSCHFVDGAAGRVGNGFNVQALAEEGGKRLKALRRAAPFGAGSAAACCKGPGGLAGDASG